jgi:multisubunit Na+/H+ antiporter MnhE subunit
MAHLKEILTIIFSAMIGASSSMMVTILANRRITNPLFNIFYSLKVYGLIILCLIFILGIIHFMKD